MKHTASTFKHLAAAAGLALAPFTAQAALTTLSPPDWPPVPSSGLENVLFNVQSDGIMMVALGAHGYKNGVDLVNDGISTFHAMLGTYPGEPDRANWSFDFSYNLNGICSSCTVVLRIDRDPSAGKDFVEGELKGTFGESYMDAWNLEMPFLSGIGFNPDVMSITDFELVVRNSEGRSLLSTNITVVAGVPEPASWGLVGVALAGLGVARRRVRQG